jgi:branched-chain amino acid transport system substrate-binding protein
VLNPRDKWLAGMFAVQLGAAAAFGAVLVHGLGRSTTTVAAIVPGAGGPAGAAPAGVAVSAPASSGPAAAPVPGAVAPPAGPRTVTSIVGGSAAVAGSAGGAAPSAAASGAAGAAGSAGSAPGGAAKKTAGASKTAAAGKPGAGGGGGAAGAPAGGGDIPPGQPIKLGSIVTQSGAINFRSSAQGTKAYIDMVNAAGGVAGHQIQLIQDDDQLSAATGNAEFKSLAAQGIFAYAAFNAPQTEGSIKSQLDGEGIPLIGSYGEYDEYHDPLAFAFTADYIHYGFEMGAYLKSLGSTKPALLFVDNNDAKANGQIKDGFAAGFGGAPAYTAVKAPTDTYQSDIISMRQNGVDGLASILDQGSYQRFLQAAGSYAQQLKHVADPLFNTPDVKKQPNADGTYVASDFAFTDSTDPAVTAYVNAVTAQFGGDAQIDYIGEVGWLDAKLVVDALKSMNGVFTRPGLVKAVEGLGTYTSGLTSPLPFSPGNRDINRCIQFGKVSGGKVVPTQGYTCDTQPA